MPRESIVIQTPEAQASQLFLLFHGVGATPASMLATGLRLAASFPQAFIVSVAAPLPSDMSAGFQWFSVMGIDETTRPGRVKEALPRFLAEVEYWQKLTGVAPVATALVGFSQGAIMALESTKSEQLVAGRIIAFAGRFVVLPDKTAPDTVIHLIHGKADETIHYRHTVEAAHRLIALKTDVTADVIPFAVHSITEEFLDIAIERLMTHIPKKIWDEAQASAQGN